MSVPPLKLNFNAPSSADGDVYTSFQSGTFNAATGGQGISPLVLLAGVGLAVWWFLKKG